MGFLRFAAFLSLLLASAARAAAPDWSEGFPVPAGGNANPYALAPNELAAAVSAGRLHAQEYPVEATGMLPPFRPVKEFFDKDRHDPLKDFLRSVMTGLGGIRSFNDVLAWIGLHPYPSESDRGVYAVPYPSGKRPDYPMGFSVIERNGAEGFTISCAECHSSRLFGKTVLGMTNRFPNANKTFIHGKTLALLADPTLFRIYNGSTEEETDLLRELRRNVRAIGVRRPIALGLDTSLAQVALSLARRSRDPYAERSPAREVFPRHEELAAAPADSKPAVWWNVKFKNRWLSDGSVLSGNPILTNLLWNEIGRGADLHALDDWILRNGDKIRELTSAVFSSEAPRFTDFFPAERFPIASARRGEAVFNRRCARCHGTYEKAWSAPGTNALPAEELLRTARVRYHERTLVVDVGTDPNRRLGMRSLEQLNELAIARANGIRVAEQNGYVPPPLVGIWARWPYFHNNSVPSLCAVLTRPEKRPSVYYSGPAEDRELDFDGLCNGYPTGKAVPARWKRPAFRYDTKKNGLGNGGHAEGIFLREGKELLTPEEKLDLVRFLQTL